MSGKFDILHFAPIPVVVIYTNTVNYREFIGRKQLRNQLFLSK